MPDLTTRLAALTAAVEACHDRIDPAVYDRARTVVERVDRRLSLAPDVTVVAIAGATGSGKSSLFNALTRTTLAEPGLQRPTTQRAAAITFGHYDTSSLLDWLGISRRHTTTGLGLDGIVLLDLADYDSVELSHRDEVDRLLEVVDEFLWVVDPQKYADSALHDGYLRRFAGHSDVMTFVLNQIDRLTTEQSAVVLRDLGRLLRDDGLPTPVVYEVSALSGQGIDGLRQHLAEAASTKRSMAARLEADITEQAKALRPHVSREAAGALSRRNLTLMTTAALEAGSVNQVGQAVESTVKQRGRVATGWPLLSWVGRLRANPLRRLGLKGSASSGDDPARLTRSSIQVHPVARAKINTAVRAVTDEAGSRLPRLWRNALERMMTDQSSALPDALDQAVVSTNLGVTEGHGWWAVVRFLQWLILVAAVFGLVWLVVNMVLTAFLDLPSLPVPRVGRVGLPTILLVGGVVAGLILAGLSRLAVGLGAKTSASRAVRRLRTSLESVVADRVISPVNAELQRHDRAWQALTRLLK